MRGRGRRDKDRHNGHATARELAASFAARGFEELVRLAMTGDGGMAQVRACRMILDLAYGKPKKATALEEEERMSDELLEFIEGCEARQEQAGEGRRLRVMAQC